METTHPRHRSTYGELHFFRSISTILVEITIDFIAWLEQLKFILEDALLVDPPLKYHNHHHRQHLLLLLLVGQSLL